MHSKTDENKNVTFFAHIVHMYVFSELKDIGAVVKGLVVKKKEDF